MVRAVLSVAWVLWWSVSALGQPPPRWDSDESEATEAAVRSARADAITRVVAQVKKLRITPDLTVEAMLRGRPAARVDLYCWASALRESQTPNSQFGAQCRVVVQVPVEDLVGELKRICAEHCRDRAIDAEAFAKIGELNDQRVIRQTGIARDARPAWRRWGKMLRVNQAGLLSADNLQGRAKLYWASHVAAPGRLAAVQAAHARAGRQLAERIKAIHITPQMNLGGFVASSGDAEADIEGFLPAARPTGIYYHPEAPIVEVRVQVPLRTVYLAVNSWAKSAAVVDEATRRQLEQLVLRTGDEVISEIGVGVPPAEHLSGLTASQEAAASLARGGAPWIALRRRSAGSTEAGARRRMARDIGRLPIAADLTIGDFLGRDEARCIAFVRYMQQAEAIDRPRRSAEGDTAAEVAVEVALDDLWDMLLFCAMTGPTPTTAEGSQGGRLPSTGPADSKSMEGRQ